MAIVKVYRAKRYESATDSYRVSTRMYTREAIEASKSLEIMPQTETEIDRDKLVHGEGWTPENFDPKKSN